MHGLLRSSTANPQPAGSLWHDGQGPGRRHALSFERIFSMGEPIDDLLVNQITAGMLDADSEDDKKLWADMVPTYMKKVEWRG